MEIRAVVVERIKEVAEREPQKKAERRKGRQLEMQS